MNNRPFTIRILVAEGVADGLRFVEKSNWVGHAIICPRGRYPQVKKRDEFANSGVYILVGRETDDVAQTLYIGEAETVRDRLDSHYAKKDFWQQAVVFTTKGDPLNKAEVQYLEARLVELAKKHNRCVLDNANQPNRPGLSAADEAEVEGYLHEMLSLLPVIGVDVFDAPERIDEGDRTYTWQGTGWTAKGYETSAGFAVSAGSIARAEVVPSMDTYRKSRDRLIERQLLVPCDEGLRLTDDHEFNSPSEAATVFAGRNTNGREAWLDAEGVSLKEHQQREAES